ncbi:MAG: copper chaperone PCu(A)C [Parvibaculaceae bacterium]|nr:copper chaperone PCu(A)C [Parvibaculaceae bacterium]
MNSFVFFSRSRLSQLCSAVILASTLSLFPLITSINSAQAHEEVGLLMTDGWVRVSLGAGKTTAAYVTLDNSHGPSDVLLSVHTPAASAAEIHTMTMDGDVMRMRRMENAPIPNGDKLNFQPGGMHLMLIGLTSQIKAGDEIVLTFVFEKMGEKTLTLKAMKKAPTPHHAGDHKMMAPAAMEHKMNSAPKMPEKASEMKMDHSMHDMMGHGAN